MGSTLATPALAASTVTTTPTAELGQLKVCKVAGTGVALGTLFTFKVGNNNFNVPAGPADSGYCVLAGQYPLNTELTIEEVIPGGYYVSRIEVKPDHTVSKNTSQGTVTVKIGSGVTEAIFTNKVAGSPTPTRTPTSVNTPTPKPTKTASPTPSCSPNCTPTPTPIPTGRLQICKEADGDGVTGYFTFKFETRSRSVPVGACAGLISVNTGRLTITEVKQPGYELTDVYTIPANRLISKNLSGGSAIVTIVEGTASSQTIVVFRNRSVSSTGTITATSTATATPTATSTGTITATSTATATPTATSTGTITATSTSTSTGTPTSTSTGTITATFTATATSTATATGTSTPTLTPTSTTPPSLCPPSVIFANFNNVPIGQSVEGLGVVAPYLNIDAKKTAVKVLQATGSAAYFAPPGSTNINGGLAGDGGFTDLETKNAFQPHLYNFTFAPGVSVTNFSLHMLDFGDWNPTLSTSHYASMTAYNATGNVVSKEELSYTTLATDGPRSSNLYGDLRFNGDAVSAPLGQPGNWIWNVSGNGIVRVVLEFGVGYDPNVAFDLLSFTTQCASCQSLIVPSFNNVPAGQSVEGLGVVAPYLNINAKGTAVKIMQAKPPLVYQAPNGTTNINASLAGDGGFSDVITKDALQPHLYTFTFSSGISITNFSLHMLDFGDWNPSLSTSHFASMTTYNANGNVVSKEELSYTTLATDAPRSSSLYGDLWINGDAATAPLGQPGNWIWNVSGNGIVRVVLEFGAGYDPNIGFDLLSFSIVCQ